jgi:FPC/CPF motif-containing protein YcgG
MTMALLDQSAFHSPNFPLLPWHKRVHEQLGQRLRQPSSFPCTFSQNAFRKELIFYSFVEKFDSAGAIAAAWDLMAYTDHARGWDGSINTARPLVVAFSHEAAQFDNLEDYHAFGWKVLQKWHEFDPAEWPKTVARDPNKPFWSMCFNKTQLFINMSNPLHRVRKSRNLGDHLVFIVNPRERFDIVAGDTPEGRNIRGHIRRRVEDYDGIPHCHQLGSYQAGEVEWWQYGIIEQNAERTDRCPFHFREKATVA